MKTVASEAPRRDSTATECVDEVTAPTPANPRLCPHPDFETLGTWAFPGHADIWSKTLKTRRDPVTPEDLVTVTTKWLKGLESVQTLVTDPWLHV